MRQYGSADNCPMEHGSLVVTACTAWAGFVPMGAQSSLHNKPLSAQSVSTSGAMQSAR